MGIAVLIIGGGIAVVALSFLLDKTAAGSSSSTTAASTGTGTGTTPSAPSSSTAASIMTYLQAAGLTRIAAAGIVGNLQQESSLNPNESGGGLAQWQAPRGPSDWSLAGQLSYLVSDLKGSYAGLLTELNQATTPAQAATLFSDQYERPGIPMIQNRINYANAAYAGG